MTGISGWSAVIVDEQLREAALKRMTEAAAIAGAVAGQSLSTSAWAVKSTAPDKHTANQHGLSAVMDGEPRFTDSNLAQCAQDQNAAAAVLQGYRQYGKDIVRHLRGAFALAVFDHENDSILLAVDRMGTRPLCYAEVQGGIVFGSSVEAVRRHPTVTADLSPQALFDYVYFHVIPSQATIYTQIRKLEPAQYLYCHAGNVQLQHYWQPDFAHPTAISCAALETDLMAHLRRAVQRCHSGAHTGAFLSGGLDSSTVAGLLAEINDSTARTYSIGFSADTYDEMAYARIAAQHFATEQTEYYVTPDDVATAIPQIAAAYDEPFGNSSAIPTYFCARLAREHGTTVLLAGDGGDELFAGNKRYAVQKTFQAYHGIPQGLRQRLIEPMLLGDTPLRRLPGFKKLRGYVEKARLAMPERLNSYNFLQRGTIADIFSEEFLHTIDSEHPHALLNAWYHQAPAADLLHRMLYLDWKLTLADNDLRKVNRMCELAGVKVRYPMLDDDVVEFSTRVPAHLKLKGTRLRYFYKQSMRNFLPVSIIKKTKHGFGLPFGEWLKTSTALQEIVYGSLDALKQRGIVRAGFLDELISTHKSGHAAYYGTQIWVFMMLEQWLNAHSPAHCVNY